MKPLDPDKVDLKFKYFHYIASLFVLNFVLSNILASKIASLGSVIFPAGMVSFPLSYILGDILTEVYGFQRTRQLLFFTISCQAFVVFFICIAVNLPAASFYHDQDKYISVLLPQIQIVAASCIAYYVGDNVNNKYLAKLKLRCRGDFMISRFIISTALGVLVDNTIFTCLAYFDIFKMSYSFPLKTLAWLIFSQYLIKVSYEASLAPIAAFLSRKIKENEKTDIYDVKTNFSIFNISIDESLHENRYGTI